MKTNHRIIKWLALLALAIFNAQLSTVFAQLTFATNTYSVGKTPTCVVAADVNGDGFVDLISANGDNNTLTVLTNNGCGGFGSNATLTESPPVCVVAADVNGDGKLDLITANNDDNTLTVLINTTVFPPPSLNIASASDQVALYWPAWATNYVLESNSDLSTTNWAVVTNGTPTTGGVTVSNTMPAAFFRLHGF